MELHLATEAGGLKGRVIGLFGKKRAGKDAACDSLTRDGVNVMRHKFAETLKELTSAFLLDLPGGHAKDELKEDLQPALDYASGGAFCSYRQALQVIGSELFRDRVHPDIWVRIMDLKLGEHLRRWQENPFLHIITDCRFPNEAALVRKMGGCLVQITRPGCEGDSHQSETSADGIEFDAVIENKGDLQDLRFATAHAIDDLIEKGRLKPPIITSHREWVLEEKT